MGSKIIYRNATMDDVDALFALDAKKWGKELTAGKEIWRERIKTFSEGIYLAELEGQLIGVAASHIVEYPKDYIPTWAEITGNGLMSNHNPNGNMIYGVDFSVDTDEEKVAANLLLCLIDNIANKRKLPGMLGCPAPFVSEYRKKNKDIEINEKIVEQLAHEDPLITHLFKALGFRIICARKDYLPEDEDSEGWGIILRIF